MQQLASKDLRERGAVGPEIVLAPMEGLVDDVMRDVLTRIGGIDLCVTEFVRVTSALLPPRTYQRLAPELACGARTRAGTPVQVQLLGSAPDCLAQNAQRAVQLGAQAIDLNFGCPAKSVNLHRGGAVLLDEPELLYQIVAALRQALPDAISVSAKMRLGYADKSRALECAQALVSAGASRLTVHARTKLEGYRPPAHWDWVARIRQAVAVPVVANGEVWSLEDFAAIMRISGCHRVMIGRGLIARPDLARMIRQRYAGQPVTPYAWDDMLPCLLDFFLQCQQKPDASRYAIARLKQWLGQLKRGFPEAAALFERVRAVTEPASIQQVLCQQIEAARARQA